MFRALRHAAFASLTDCQALAKLLVEAPRAGSQVFAAFTCKICEHRVQKLVSKRVLESGTVLVKCDGCDNRHILADQLNLFGEGADIKAILQRKGIAPTEVIEML